MDEEYVREREVLLREKPKLVGEGIALAFRDLALGVYKGVTSAVLDPIQGAATEGMSGLMKGVAKGAVG